MSLLEQQFRTLREQTSGAAPPDRTTAVEAIGVALALWEGVRRRLSNAAAAEARDPRDSERTKLRLLRAAEECLVAAKASAAELARQHVRVPERGQLDDALDACHAELLMPTAVQLARRDPDKRPSEWFRDHLLERVEFRLGRPVLTPELMAQFPCPIDPESVA